MPEEMPTAGRVVVPFSRFRAISCLLWAGSALTESLTGPRSERPPPGAGGFLFYPGGITLCRWNDPGKRQHNAW